MGASGLPPWSKLHGGTPLYQPHPRHELAVPSRPGRHHHRLDLLHTGTGSMPWRDLVTGAIARAVDNFATITPLTNAHFLSI